MSYGLKYRQSEVISDTARHRIRIAIFRHNRSRSYVAEMIISVSTGTAILRLTLPSYLIPAPTTSDCLNSAVVFT